jgi:alkylhydroperoxidase/carboxymuconolactone decarboxylase family protein YurZ
VKILLSLSVLIGFSAVMFVRAARAQDTASYDQTALTTLSKISASGAAGQFDTAEQLFKDGKGAGLSELQMYETVLNLLPYIGYPRTLSTLGSFQKVYPDYITQRSQGKAPKSTEPWQEYAPKVWGERGAKVQEQLSGGSEANKELIQRLGQVSPELAEWVRYDDFGRVFGRAGLSLIEREAIVLGALIAQGAPQISFHYKAMLRVGGDDALVDALLDAVSGIVDDKALAAARQYIAEARK